MSCGRAGDAILDELGLNLRSSKRGRPKKAVDATVVSASRDSITAGPSNANPDTPSDVAQLQSTFDALAEQMAWFVDKLRGDVDDTPSDTENTDTAELPQAAGVSDSDGQAGQSAAATDPGADTMTGIESFYAASANVGPDIDAQLAKIVSGFLTTRLPDDKLKEKLTACLAPKNCASIVSARVNAEIWDKLSTQTKSLSLGAYPRQDVAAQMSLQNCFRSSATLLAAVIVPNVSVMSFSHLCLGFPRLLFPATIPCIIVFSKPLCRVTWPKYLSFCRLTKLYIQFVGR